MIKTYDSGSRFHSFSWLITFNFVFSLGLAGILNAQTYPLPVTRPDNAYILPLSGKADLQKALDTHKIIVLEKGDYTIANSSIILKSGYQLYGDPAGTSLPPVIIEAGTTGAVLSTVTIKEGVSFPKSAELTSGNVIERLIGKLVVNGASLQDNLFLHIDGQIFIDTRLSGFMRNNRFIRCKTHALWPQLTILGDTGRQSYGNVFVWYNFLTPHGDATNITNQKDLTIVGFDAETWNQYGTGTNTAVIKTGPMGTLRIFGANGGNHGKYQTPAFDVAAEEFQIYNNLMESSRGGTSDYVFTTENRRSLLVNSSSPRLYKDGTINAFSIKAFEAGSADFEVNGTAKSSLTPDQAEILSSIITEKRTGNPWEAPVYGTIPDPAGSDWNKNLSEKPENDNTDFIQGLIDTKGVARLPAGIYYISRPLKIGISQGIAGAGADKTAIIALNTSLDMIVANDKDPGLPTGRKIILSGITLQGGANGIHFEPVGTGTLTENGTPVPALNSDGTPKISRGNPINSKAQYTACYFNDVTFRDMSVAGVFMDQIYALDNIFLSYLNFVNCDVGWKQKVDPAYHSPRVSGETPTMMYMDKVMFYGCQFTGNRIALELPGNRGCNLNAWVNCKFENNREGVSVMTSYRSPLFSNCDFIGNGGTAVLSSDMPVSFVSCRFRAGRDNIAIFRGPVSAEGCTFESDGATGSTILTPDNNNVKVFFINCISNDMPLGLTSQISGMLVNSVMMPSDKVNQRMVLIKSGTVQPVLDYLTTGTKPRTQLLFGSDWSSTGKSAGKL